MCGDFYVTVASVTTTTTTTAHGYLPVHLSAWVSIGPGHPYHTDQQPGRTPVHTAPLQSCGDWEDILEKTRRSTHDLCRLGAQKTARVVCATIQEPVVNECYLSKCTPSPRLAHEQVEGWWRSLCLLTLQLKPGAWWSPSGSLNTPAGGRAVGGFYLHDRNRRKEHTQTSEKEWFTISYSQWINKSSCAKSVGLSKKKGIEIYINKFTYRESEAKRVPLLNVLTCH